LQCQLGHLEAGVVIEVEFVGCLGSDIGNSGGIIANGGVIIEGQTTQPHELLVHDVISLVLGLRHDASEGVDHIREEIVGDNHQEGQEYFLNHKEISLDSYPLMRGKVLKASP
jgi:hypothetical protein